MMGGGVSPMTLAGTSSARGGDNSASLLADSSLSESRSGIDCAAFFLLVVLPIVVKKVVNEVFTDVPYQ
jgi:hypothetical protein